MSVTTVCIVEALLRGDSGAVSSDSLRILGWSFGFLLTSIILQYLQVDAKLPALAFGLFVGISLYTTTLTNFTRAGSEKELLSQVHTTEKSSPIISFVTKLFRKSAQ